MDVSNAVYAPIPDKRPPASAGRGRGRKVAPSLDSTLGPDVRVVQKAIHLPGSEVPFIINRQVLDLAVEGDFDASKHEPTDAYKKHLENVDLTGDDFYENPYAETGGMKMSVAPQEVEDFRNYVNNPDFRRRAQLFSVSSGAVTDRIERARGAFETTAEGANLRELIKESNQGVPALADQLAKANLLPREQAIRDKLLPPATLQDVDRIPIAEIQSLPTGELRRLLALDFLPGVGDTERSTFLTMPCPNTIVRRVWPHLLVPERFKKHFNVVELVDHMISAGCKYHSMSRAESKERLADVLDDQHYSKYIVFDKQRNFRVLKGGHEHYDEKNRRTRFVVFHFYCVLKPKETKEQRQKKMAERLVGLARQAEKEDEDNAYFDVNQDIWDDTGVEDDDDYTGGNDLHNPASKFIYRCNVVCVEAVDCQHRNEALEPVFTPPPVLVSAAAATAAPTKTSGIPRDIDSLMDDDMDEDDILGAVPPPSSSQRQQVPTSTMQQEIAAMQADEDKTDPTVVPDGMGQLTIDSSRVLVGKFKAAAFISNCQGSNPLYPLCLRSMQFSIGQGIE